MYSLVEDRDVVNTWMERYGVRFGIYKNGTFREQLFPFDAIPRVISAKDWLRLEKGLKQRVETLNLFLADIYGPCHILKNGIIPGDFVFSSRGYLPQCRGITPPFGVAAHIAGIDLVQAEDDNVQNFSHIFWGSPGQVLLCLKSGHHGRLSRTHGPDVYLGSW